MQKMVSRHELIEQMGDNFLYYVQMGLIPVSMTMWKAVYEAYKKELGTVKKSQAVSNVANDYDLQRRQVYNIIKFMSAEFQTR